MKHRREWWPSKWREFKRGLINVRHFVLCARGFEPVCEIIASVFNLGLYPTRIKSKLAKLAYYYSFIFLVLHLDQLIPAASLCSASRVMHVHFARVERQFGDDARCIMVGIADTDNVLNRVLARNLSTVEPQMGRTRSWDISRYVQDRIALCGWLFTSRKSVGLMLIVYLMLNGEIIYTESILRTWIRT